MLYILGSHIEQKRELLKQQITTGSYRGCSLRGWGWRAARGLLEIERVWLSSQTLNRLWMNKNFATGNKINTPGVTQILDLVRGVGTPGNVQRVAANSSGNSGAPLSMITEKVGGNNFAVGRLVNKYGLGTKRMVQTKVRQVNA